MPFYRLDHISLYVRDLEVSARFYVDVLGLSEIENLTGQPHIRWFQIDMGRSVHLIAGATGPVPDRPMSAHFALASSDFDAVLDDLTRKGVAFGDLTDPNGRVGVRADGVRQVYLQDPDGYWIEINNSEQATTP